MPAACAEVEDDAQRRWLSRGRLVQSEDTQEPLLEVLAAMGQPPPAGGLGALRLWGQTGDRPGVWVAAADPVHLEAMLDHLRIRSLQRDEVDLSELRELYRSVQDTLGDERLAFVRIGNCGYLRGAEPIASADVSADAIDFRRPDDFTLQGGDVAKHDALMSELQMILHAHPVNDRRAAAGRRTVNSLWVWGGGFAPEFEAREMLPLFSNDPLFEGYWRSCSGSVDAWKGDFGPCLATDARGFVVATRPAPPPRAAALTGTLLSRLRELQRAGRLSRLTLVFRDGVRAELGRRDHLRFWRRRARLPGAGAS